LKIQSPVLLYTLSTAVAYCSVHPVFPANLATGVNEDQNLIYTEKPSM
jgi:hypothetical protein